MFLNVQQQAEAGAEIVMLDNFDPPGLKQAAEQVKARFPHVTIEASGVRMSVFLCVGRVDDSEDGIYILPSTQNNKTLNRASRPRRSRTT